MFILYDYPLLEANKHKMQAFSRTGEKKQCSLGTISQLLFEKCRASP